MYFFDRIVHVWVHVLYRFQYSVIPMVALTQSKSLTPACSVNIYSWSMDYVLEVVLSFIYGTSGSLAIFSYLLKNFCSTLIFHNFFISAKTTFAAHRNYQIDGKIFSFSIF